MDLFWLGLPGLAVWSSILVLPWQPWSTRESLEADKPALDENLGEITVLIPARNESAVIARTLSALSIQGRGHRIFVIDDQSEDGTAEAAFASGVANLNVVTGQPLAEGWTGKLWALEQGRQLVNSSYVLLLDADIQLMPGIVSALLKKLRTNNLALVSLMAYLRMEGFWERLLMPAFIYFFKLLYPFALSNSPNRLVAAAAGGCILMRTDALNEIGGFGAIRTALIDDCSLARSIKNRGHRTWTGLSRSVISHREYSSLSDVWAMVARTAYAQLHHSIFLLLICTSLMVAAFVMPFAALFQPATLTMATGTVGLAVMTATFLPTIRYYGLNPLWALTLSASGVLFLLMTWSSAARYWSGRGAAWKDRHYLRPTGP